MGDADLNTKLGLYEKLNVNKSTIPDKPAIYDKTGSFIVYKDVFTIYTSFKLVLSDLKVKPFERIAIFSGDEIIAAVLAMVAYDNAVMIPIDYESSEENCRYYLDLLDVDYIVVDSMDNNAVKSAEEMGIGILTFTAQETRNSIEFNLSSSKTKNITPGKEKKADYVRVSTTSGTTSTPKIVPQTKSVFMTDINNLIKHFEYSSNDVLLSRARIFKGYTTSLVFRMLYLGGTIILAGDIGHKEFYHVINKYGVTVLTTVPAVLSSFSRYAQLNELNPIKTSLRFIGVAGAPLSENLKEYIEKLFNCKIAILYGMTECSAISTTFKAGKGYKPGSVGTAYLLDVKISEEEILVRGDTVFKGYDNEDVDNSESFSDGWFHTGDTGYIDDDGYIYVTGRIKEMINRGGEKVSPYEVENALLRLGFIKDAAVFPYPGLHNTENVGAVIVIEEDINTDIKQIRKLLEGKLPTFKMPKLIFIVDEIPHGESGKVQRKKLYEQLKDSNKAQDLNKSRGISTGLSRTERIVKKIWSKILKKKISDINAAFTDIGGDSMDGAVVLGEMESRLNVRVPVNILFENGSIKSVSQYIERKSKEENRYKYIVPVKSSGSKRPLFCIHSGIGDAVTYRHIGKEMNEERPIYGLRFDRKSDWPHPLGFDHLSCEYIKEITRLQPEGPYHLCGHCWGGVLAYKIASDLKKSGKDVGLVAMLDSVARDSNVSSSLKLKGTSFNLSFIGTIKRSIREIKQVSFKEKIKYFFRKTRNIGNFLRLKYARKIYEYGIKNKNRLIVKFAGKTGMLDYAYINYKPDAFDGIITYVKSNEKLGNNSAFTDYWKNLSREFSLIEMNCAHNDIVVGSNAEILAGKLDDIMRAIDA